MPSPGGRAFTIIYGMKLSSFLLPLLLPACLSAAVKKPAANVADRKAPATPEAPIILTTSTPGFCILGAQSGKSYSGEAAFKAVLWKNDVIYVGETHDEEQDHRAQLEALKALRIARGSRIAVALEMLDYTAQPALDDYLTGKISEAEFQEKTGWQSGKGFDYSLYKPLLDFAAANGLRGLALNIPKAIVSKIARGGLQSLTAEERQALPKEVNITSHKKYNEYLKESFTMHSGTAAPKDLAFENYRASMGAWNEAMGARIADFIAANPGFAVLVITGNGHLMYNAAIPASVKARTEKLRQVSFYTEQAESCPEKMPEANKNVANYIWYIKHPAPPAAAPVQASTSAPAAAGR